MAQYYLDIETTGLDPEIDQIITIQYQELENAALNLGASPIRVFLTISLPLAWRNIVSGLIMMFARGMSEFGAIVIVAYHPMTAPVLIYERFNQFGLSYARLVSVIFILAALAVFVLLRMISVGRRSEKSSLVKSDSNNA